jgi:hypothetical protein
LEGLHGAEIDLGLPALLPGDYLPDVHTRLVTYKRIASAADPAELKDLQVEMIDRFGLLPPQTKALFAIKQGTSSGTVPGIEQVNPGRLEVARISGHHGESMPRRARRDQHVGMAEGVPALAAGFDRQTPLQQGVLAQRQDTTFKHWP